MRTANTRYFEPGASDGMRKVPLLADVPMLKPRIGFIALLSVPIEKALTRRRPRPRYPVTPSARLIMGQRRLLSDRMWDRFVGSQFPQPQ